MRRMSANWIEEGEKHSTKLLVALFILSLAAFLATIPLPRSDGMLIGSDGIGYYAYVRSIGIDHDIDFANEYQRLYPAVDLSQLKTSTGLTANHFAVGPAILWLPFFIVAHLISLALQSLGFSVTTDGYSYTYQAAVCIGSVFYGFFGMMLMHRTTRRLFADTALVACVLLLLATNYIYYLIVEPSMSHMCSLFATSLMMYIWITTRPTGRLRECFAIGLAGGLIGLVRLPDITLLLMPLLDFMFLRASIFEKGKRIVAVVAGFFSVFWIQMLVWNTLNGNQLLSGYPVKGEQGFSWFSPHLLEVLASTQHGLFTWHPILLFAFIGLVLLNRIDRWLSALLLLGFFSQAYLIASWWGWTQGDSFGGRMFVASLPIFVIGLALFLRQVAMKKNLAYLSLAGGGVLVLWNALFLIQYRMGYISASGPYSIRELTVGKAEMVIDIVSKFLG